MVIFLFQINFLMFLYWFDVMILTKIKNKNMYIILIYFQAKTHFEK